MRSRVQKITPKKAAELLEANTTNRPISHASVRTYAEAMRAGEWKVTHQGIAFDADGVLVDGQHRLAAVVEAGVPVEMTVFTEVDADTFDVLDTGKRRNASDALAIEGEKSATQLASMLRTIWLVENRPDAAWSGAAATPSNPQILDVLRAHPRLREFVKVGEQIYEATGMVRSAAGASSYLVESANSGADLTDWYDGLVVGAGLTRSDPRLKLRNLLTGMARKQANQAAHRRDLRQHVALYVKAFNSWATGESIQLRYSPRESLPVIATRTG